MFDTITHPKQRAFLAAYAVCGIVEDAAKIAEISRELHYDWKREQPEYRAAFEHARELAADALEDEATRRAQFGVTEPFVYRGQVVMHNGQPLMRQRYSDTLLLPMLRARKSEYREKTEVSVTPIDQSAVNLLDGLTDQELDLLERLIRKAYVVSHPLQLEGANDASSGAGATPETEEAAD